MNDELYMQRAIELAKKGTGFVNPNPLVGAVIVKDDIIIGEGTKIRQYTLDLWDAEQVFILFSQEIWSPKISFRLSQKCMSLSVTSREKFREQAREIAEIILI